MLVEFIPVASHDKDSNVKKAKVIKDDDLVFCVLIEVNQELIWHISPMNSWVDMMCHMVTIVEGVLVIEMDHWLEGESAVESVWFQILWHGSDVWVHKNVLREVSEHHGEPTENTWK